MLCTKVNYHGVEYNRKKYYDVDFYVYKTRCKRELDGIRTIAYLCMDSGELIGMCFIDDITWTDVKKEIKIKEDL